MPGSLTASPPRGLTRALARLPIWLYRAGLGWLLGDRFLLLTHTGRVSGLPRRVVIEVVQRDTRTNTYTVASAWGTKSDWYRNILKTPQVTVQVGQRRWAAVAEQLSEAEAERALAEYAHQNPAAAKVLAKFMGHPVEHVEIDFPKLSSQLPLIALRPDQEVGSH